MKIYGKDLVVVWWNEDREQWESIAYARSCQLEVSREMLEVGTPWSGAWRYYVPRAMTWGATISHLMSTEDSLVQLERLMTEGRDVLLCFVVERGPYGGTGQALHAEGRAYVSSIKYVGDVGAMAQMEAELQGTGDLRYQIGFGLNDKNALALYDKLRRRLIGRGK